MKTSNVLVALWILLVAGIALIAVYFLQTPDTPTNGQTPPAIVPGNKAPGTNEPPKGPKVVKPPRTPTPQVPKEQPKVTGHVIDAERKPVAGAIVRLLPPTKPVAPQAAPDMAQIRRVAQIVTLYDEWEAVRPLSAWSDMPPADASRSGGHEIAQQTTGADGSFSFTLGVGTSKGPYRLSARGTDVGSASASNVFGGQDFELMLSSGGVVQGKVTADATGEPVAAAKVVFDSGDREYGATSDEKGDFRIDGMPPGRFTVRAGAAGLTPILEMPVQVVRGEPVQIKLPRGTILRVKAIAMDGTAARGTEPPLGNVEVVALEETAQVYVVGTTNDYGTVDFPGLPPGNWTVNGRVVGYVSQGEELPKIEANQEIVEAELTFEPAVNTPLQVVDESGAPLAGVEFFTSDSADAYDSIKSEKLAGATDDQGKYSFAFEFNGTRCMVFGFKRGFGLVQAYPDDYSAGDPVQLVAKKAVRVHGLVSDEKGNGVPDAIVRMTFEAGAADKTIADSVTVQVRTDAKGRYDFAFLPAGYEISVEAESADAWSDDMPTVEFVEGKYEYQVDMRLEATPAPRAIEAGGQKHPLDPMAPDDPADVPEKK
ncbi:MAG: carboxypeptidase regulatory-like domain-containing protein [Planctomycetes bacterium]|nr:carboxypeptidase regulatory-like domain-containing protein [Planctomycetota bacterium]